MFLLVVTHSLPGAMHPLTAGSSLANSHATANHAALDGLSDVVNLNTQKLPDTTPLLHVVSCCVVVLFFCICVYLSVSVKRV